MSSYRYMKSHCGDKTVLRSSYLHNGISYTDKITSLYWIRALVVIHWSSHVDSNKVLLRNIHDNVIKLKHFPRYWSFVRGIHRSPVDSPHKGQWRRALNFSLICAWTNDWAKNREADDLRRHRAHYDVTEIYRTFLIEITCNLFKHDELSCHIVPR